MMVRRQQNPGLQRLKSTWSGWEPRALPELHVPGQPAQPGKPSTSQIIPQHAEEPGVLRKWRFFYFFLCSSAAFSSAQTKNLAQRWSPTCGINAATWHSVKSLTWVRSGFYTMFYWWCYASHQFCIIYSHMCQKLTRYTVPNFVILLFL